MTQSDLHQRKKAKNYAVMGTIVGFIVLIFVVTILKMTH